MNFIKPISSLALILSLTSCEMPNMGIGGGGINSISDIADLSREEFDEIDNDAKDKIQKKFDEGLSSADKKLALYGKKYNGSSPFNYNFKTNGLLAQLPLSCDTGEFQGMRDEIKRIKRGEKRPIAGRGQKVNYSSVASEYDDVLRDLNTDNNKSEILKSMQDWYIDKTKADGQKLSGLKYDLGQNLKDLTRNINTIGTHEVNTRSLDDTKNWIIENAKGEDQTYVKISTLAKIKKMKEIAVSQASTQKKIDTNTKKLKRKLVKNFKDVKGVDINTIQDKSIEEVNSFINNELKVALVKEREDKDKRLEILKKEIVKRDLAIDKEMNKVETESTCIDDKNKRKKSLLKDYMLLGKKQLLCDPSKKKTSLERASDDQNHYNQIVADLENNAHLVRILMRIGSNEEIENHKKALKSIPVGIARDAFVNAAGMDKSKLIIPPGSKEVLEKIKEKYRALKDVQERLSGLKLLHNKGKGQSGWSKINPFTAWGDYSNNFEQSKKEAIEAIEKYDEIGLDEEMKHLKKNNFKFENEDTASTISNGKLSDTKTYLSSLRKIKKEGRGTEMFIGDAEEYQKKLDKKIKDIEKNQLRDMEKMVAQMFCGSGNTDAYVSGANRSGSKCSNPDIASSGDVLNYLKGSDNEGFEDSEKGKLSERLEEVTGFTFDPDMTFDLIKTTTVDFDDRNYFTKYSNKLANSVGQGDNFKNQRYSQFKDMFENLRSNYKDKLGPKVKDAMSFFDGYDDLQKMNIDKNSFDQNFSDPIEVLADKLKIGDEYQGGHGHGVFQEWKNDLCQGQTSSDCNMKTLFQSANRLGKTPKMIEQISSMLGLNLKELGVSLLGGEYDMSKLMEVLKKRLAGINDARLLLKSQSDGCTDDNTGSTKFTDEDDINNSRRKEDVIPEDSQEQANPSAEEVNRA